MGGGPVSLFPYGECCDPGGGGGGAGMLRVWGGCCEIHEAEGKIPPPPHITAH